MILLGVKIQYTSRKSLCPLECNPSLLLLAAFAKKKRNIALPVAVYLSI